MEVLEALESYTLQLRADGRSPHTVAQYRRHVGALAAWLVTGGHPCDLVRLDHELLAQFLVSPDALTRADGAPKRATSVNALRTSLRNFLGYAHAVGWVVRNPARLIRLARTGTPPPRSLSEEEQERLLAVLAKAEGRAARRDHALVDLLLGTGIRIGGALALRVGDLDLERGEIEVRVTKGDRPRTVFMPTQLVEHLRAYTVAAREGHLFPGQSGGPLTQRQVGRRLAEWGRAAGIKRHVTAHMLRHSFGTRLYRQTADILLVQEALGHRAIASTVMYARCSKERVRRAIGQVAGAGFPESSLSPVLALPVGIRLDHTR